MNLLCKLAVVVVALACTSVAQSTVITFEFSGTVTDVSPFFGFADPDLFAVGDELRGFYTFETNTAGVLSTSSTVGTYYYAVQNLALTVGGYEGGFGPSDANNFIYIANDGTRRDFYQMNQRFSGEVIGSPAALLPTDFGIFLDDPTGSIFNSEELFSVPPSLTNFATTTWQLVFRPAGSGRSAVLSGTLGELKAVAVPEPGTLALFGIGLAGMGLATRRKR